MKKNYILALLVLAANLAVAQLPGSGNALVFDHIDDQVTVPHHSSLVMTNAVTIETWINVAGYLSAGVIAGKTANNTVNGPGYVLYASLDDGNVYNVHFRASNATVSKVAFVFGRYHAALRYNNWVHIAATFDGSIARIYVNGILENATTAAATPFSISDANYPLTIGDVNAATNTTYKFNGKIDELKIWNIVRTEGEIRADICRKISATIPNLQAYYRFDETTGTILPDLTTNSNNGTLTGSPVWQTSGASLGDASASSYTGAASSASLTNPIRPDAFTASLNTGNADGIHVFCVNQSPNTTNGTIGVGGNSSYFGAFVANSSTAATPAYTAVYNYAGIQGLGGNMSQQNLRLYKRNNNAATLWADANATLYTSNTTLTCIGQNTEYIVGTVGTILPLKLVSFTGNVNAGHNQLDWTTDNETNTQYFNIERSIDAKIFVTIAVVPATGNSKNSYQYVDGSSIGTCYYRFKIIDRDGRSTYSHILKLGNTPVSQFAIFPNPVTTHATLQYTSSQNDHITVRVTDALGKTIYTKKQTITSGTNAINLATTDFAAGVYMVQVQGSKGTAVVRMVVNL